MTGHVRVDGKWLGLDVPTSDLRHSSRWIVDGPSGDWQSQITLGLPVTFDAEWVWPNRDFRIYSPGGALLWGGVTTREPERGAEGITLNAQGIGLTLDDFDAVVEHPTDPSEELPTFIPNDAVDYAAANGAKFSRGTNDLGDEPISTTPEDGPIVTIGVLLARAAVAQGKRVHVDSTGLISFRADPTTPDYTLTPGYGYMGTSDDQYLSVLRGYYDETPPIGQPGHGTASVPAVVKWADANAEDKFGPKQGSIDLRNLGLMTEVQAQAYIDGRGLLVGGRMGWTQTVDATTLNLRTMKGVPISPRWLKAGERLRIPGVTDSRSTPTVRASIDITLSEVRVVEQTRPTASAAPVGFAPRDFMGALRPPEKPADKEVA